MNFVVWLTVTPETEPEVANGEASSLCCGSGVMVTAVALVVVQARVVVWPPLTVEGLAVKDVT